MDKIIKFIITMELLSCLFLLIGKLNFCYYEVLKSFLNYKDILKLGRNMVWIVCLR